MRRNRCEEVASVERVTSARSPPALVIKHHHGGNTAERLRGGEEESVVWTNQHVTADTTNGDRSALRPNARINHGDMRANGKVNERLNERFSARLNVVRWDRVREIERSRVGRHRQHHTGEHASRRVTQTEVGHEGDESQVSNHWAEWIAHAMKSSPSARVRPPD